MINNLPTFEKRLSFIIAGLKNVKKHYGMEPLTQNERYELIEPYMQMLADCTANDQIFIEEPGQPEQIVFHKKAVEMWEKLKAKQKIPAIKLYREITNTGLKEAKEEVERVFDFDDAKWQVKQWRIIIPETELEDERMYYFYKEDYVPVNGMMKVK